MSEREHAAAAVAPIARAPASAPTRNITTKKSGGAGDITIVRPTAAAPTRRRVRVSLQVEMHTRSCRAGETRAGHHAPALGQGADGHHAPLSLRDQGREGI